MTYTEDQKAAALAALAANGGNGYKTARQLGIPERTLRRWKTGGVNADVGRKAEIKKSEIVADMKSVLKLLVGDLHDEDKRRKANLRDIATAAGIIADKISILTDQSSDTTTEPNNFIDALDSKIAETWDEPEPE